MSRVKKGYLPHAVAGPVAGPAGDERPSNVPPDAQPIVAVGWGVIDVVPDWYQVGRWGLPPGNQVVTLVPGPQRRNGVGDITSRWSPMYPPEWTNQYPILTPGSQRQGGAPANQGPSKYGLYKMRQAVTAAQVQQAGAQLVPFLNAMQGQPSTGTTPNG